ncbi:MAG: 30S ribosome-binding factor RbfA [Pseudomonadota bacterium]
MKLSYKRSDRLSDLIRAEISDIILKKIKDPRISLVTVTSVDVTSDLRIARVYFSALGDEEERGKAAAGLTSATGFIRKLLGSRLDLRYVPDIEFIYDQSFDYGERIEKPLKTIEKEREDKNDGDN